MHMYIHLHSNVKKIFFRSNARGDMYCTYTRRIDQALKPDTTWQGAWASRYLSVWWRQEILSIGATEFSDSLPLRRTYGT